MCIKLTELNLIVKRIIMSQRKFTKSSRKKQGRKRNNQNNLPGSAAHGPPPFGRGTNRVQMIRSLQPTFPSEFETEVVTKGYWADAGATVTTQIEIKTNSLLTSSHGLTAVVQSGAAVNVGRNYTKYRVTAYQLKLTIMPRSTSNYLLLVVHSADDLGIGSGSSWTTANNWMLPYHKMLTIPANTLSPCVLNPATEYHVLHQITGNNNYLTDDDYAGTASTLGVFTDPSNLTYCTVLANLFTAGAQTANNSPHVTVELVQFVKFFDLKT